MKKLILALIVISSLSFVRQAHAQFPIPSYNVICNGTTHFEGGEDLTRGKRDLVVNGGNKKNLSMMNSFIGEAGFFNVYVYTLDRTTILGPYRVYYFEPLIVSVDERAWGLAIITDKEIMADVYYNEP